MNDKFQENKSDIFKKDDFDTTTSPGDDFYQYANGGWLSRTEIPASESRWGSFTELHEENQKALHTILEELLENKDIENKSAKQKLRDFYQTGMNEAQIIEEEKAGGVQEELEKIEHFESTETLAEYAAYLHVRGATVFFQPIVDHDDKNAKEMVFRIHQGGLGLPERGYYFDDDKAEIREKYVTHIENILKLSGESEEKSKESATAIFEFEKTLAESARSSTELRDPEANYHKMSLSELESLAPEFDWKKYFKEIDLSGADEVIVGQPEFLENFSKNISEIAKETWQAYMKFHFLESVASKLSSDFVNENFEFGKVFSGASELKPRWKRVIGEVNGLMGEELGKLYVEKHFAEESKKRILEMVENMKAVMAEEVEKLDWMTEPTKKRALQKLENFTAKIGYPDEWRDHSNLEISDDSYVKNHLRGVRFEFAREISKVGKPADYGEWSVPPAIVNACCDFNKVQVQFPAGILQPPFFYAEANDAVNYGAIGAIIGHELTHGFDDVGRQFDENGNMNDWWTEEDAENFEARAKVLEEQFNEYSPIAGHFVNGKLTLGENIADLGGLRIAYGALQKHFEKHGRPDDRNGFTPEQRFFLGFAKFWQMQVRDELVKMFLAVDPHSPHQFRVNGSLSNMEEFYEAFGVNEEDGLYRESKDRAKIW